MRMTFGSIISLLALISCGSRSGGAVAAVSTSESVPVTSVELADVDALIEWDTLVYDFGDVSLEDGPLSCSFTFTNKSDKPVAIYEVVSSCGCTGVSWSKEPVPKGGSATIKATYNNNDGPYPFDKTLTVYISGVRRPVVLRLRGIVHDKKKSLGELYGAQKLGDFGLKSRSFDAPILRQGLQVSISENVANLGNKPLSVSFEDLSPELRASVYPNPIPAGSVAKMEFTVTANRDLWGRNTYSATPVLNGVKSSEALEVTAFTQENFSLLTDAERVSASLPMFSASTSDFGIKKKGSSVSGAFTVENRGKSPLHFFKADSESPALQLSLPADVPPSGKAQIPFTLDTSGLSAGEQVIMVSLTTNSPMRPVVNIFVAGIVE